MTSKSRKADLEPMKVKLRFGVRRANSARLSAAIMKLPDASRTQVRSLHFDTPDDCLAHGGITLRLREQAGQWVQSVKSRREAGNRVRFEHEVDVPTDGATMPAVDLDRHRGTHAGDLAIDLLATATEVVPSLVVRYESVVQRTAGRVQWGASEIDTAYLRGKVEAAGNELQVSELELELRQGSKIDLIDSATNWLQERDMWLLGESNAERGRRLARKPMSPAVTKAGALAAGKAGELDHLSSAVLGNCLEQIVPNAAAVAEGSVQVEHVHQLRVGLRRLRTALRELGVARRAVTEIEPGVTKVFRALGAHRDRQHVHEAIEQRVLRETVATTAFWAHTQAKPTDLRALVRDRQFQRALLAVMRLRESVTQGHKHRKVKSRRWLRPRIERLNRRVARCGKRFADLAVEEQHEVRKRLKRLRYLGEFAAPLFPPKRVKRYLRALEPAQDALGMHNDLAVARSMAASTCDTDPDAQLAVEWIDRAQEGTARKAARKLRKVRKAKPFW
ncbi:MAG: CHAD domain-containing protein [Betaproteobacteria bacterium]